MYNFVKVKRVTEVLTKSSTSSDYAFLLNQKIKKSSPQEDNVVTRFYPKSKYCYMYQATDYRL